MPNNSPIFAKSSSGLDILSVFMWLVRVVGIRNKIGLTDLPTRPTVASGSKFLLKSRRAGIGEQVTDVVVF